MQHAQGLLAYDERTIQRRQTTGRLGQVEAGGMGDHIRLRQEAQQNAVGHREADHEAQQEPGQTHEAPAQGHRGVGQEGRRTQGGGAGREEGAERAGRAERPVAPHHDREPHQEEAAGRQSERVAEADAVQIGDERQDERTRLRAETKQMGGRTEQEQHEPKHAFVIAVIH